ncbi:histidinol dehydrogenase [Balneolales bacterium ANBcel1]|nr:histidinol dehydrogenase [Balneolales bacterium ANBcel1]
MLKRRYLKSLDHAALETLCKRPRLDSADITPRVTSIIDQVREHGDRAVADLTETFDGVRPDPLLYPVRPLEEIPVSTSTLEAFTLAFNNILAFHKAQLPQDLEVQTMPGVICRRESRPVERVGLYIPGGSAPLPSTALMLGVPALLAGCPYRILATPPGPDGKPPLEVELAAALTGIPSIYMAGGAQAIAAMAYGTSTIRKVDKIFGPGNQYVTEAKMLLQNSDALVSLDLPAGPSEVMVLAEQNSNPAFVASDLLSQAEHGPDSQVVLVTVGDLDPEPVNSELKKQLENLPRAETARKALSHSFEIVTETAGQAIDVVNLYAPEHLVIHFDITREQIGAIQHAGSVFLGPWTPESVGDYASGTNHTLPTYGYARMYSGVSVDSFLKYITFQELDPDGLRSIGPAVATMADTEQLHAHKNAVTIRLAHLEDQTPG